MQKVQFYTKDNCSLCEDAYALLMMIQRQEPFELEEIDIYQDDALLEAYQLLIPAVRTNDAFLNCEQISLEQLENIILKA